MFSLYKENDGIRWSLSQKCMTRPCLPAPPSEGCSSFSRRSICFKGGLAVLCIWLKAPMYSTNETHKPERWPRPRWSARFSHRARPYCRIHSPPRIRDRSNPAGVSNGPGVSLGKLPLVPVRIGGRHLAGSVQSLHLICRQTPTDGPQILLQLFFVSGADNHCRYCRTL